MRNIANFQFKPSIRHLGIILASPRSQPVPTVLPSAWWNFLDAKYEKVDLLVTVRYNCSHL
jgi:hypothetical protein